MQKDILRRIDKQEEKRTDEVWKTFESTGSIGFDEIFGSNIIPQILKGKPLAYDDSSPEQNNEILPNCLLYSRILLVLCPECTCARNPAMIRPFLEREMVLPVLLYPLSRFRTEFANLVVQYPYIGISTFDLLKDIHANSCEEQGMCQHCYDRFCQRILGKLREPKEDQGKKSHLEGWLKDSIFPALTPTLKYETQILEEVENAVDQKRFEVLPHLANKAGTLYSLRNSQLFTAIPQVAQNDLSNISEILRKMNVRLEQNVFRRMEERKWIVKALDIDYDSRMPVEDYLDIIIPRRKKVNRLVDELISSHEKDRILSNIKDEIWKINDEVATSKAVEMLTFSTNFASENAQILFGMLMGGLVGYSSGGFLACGLGSTAGLGVGLVEKLVSKHVSKHEVFKISKYPRKTMEWIKEKIENPEEKLLSLMLSKDIKTIQVWALRKKLKK